MIETEIIRLMTWKRHCPLIFPYGSSIVPLVFSVITIEAPTIALVYHLVAYSLLFSLLPALIIIVDIATLVILFVCVYTDPGILPQILNNYERDEELLNLPAVNHQMRGDHSYLSVGRWGLSTLQKYCVQCHIYRPTRTIHCKSCNHCVQCYDHHCPWLGVCIGKHNYRYFVGFIALINLQVLLVVGCCLAVIIISAQQGKNIISFLLEVIVGVFCLGFGLALAKLLVYHFGLINKGLTTNEDLKDTYKSFGGKVPFSRCMPSHPPLVDIKAKLVKNNEVQMSLQSDLRQSNHMASKGKRYSTLVSIRQSVLNSLVQNDL